MDDRTVPEEPRIQVGPLPDLRHTCRYVVSTGGLDSKEITRDGVQGQQVDPTKEVLPEAGVRVPPLDDRHDKTSLPQRLQAALRRASALGSALGRRLFHRP